MSHHSVFKPYFTLQHALLVVGAIKVILGSLIVEKDAASEGFIGHPLDAVDGFFSSIGAQIDLGCCHRYGVVQLGFERFLFVNAGKLFFGCGRSGCWGRNFCCGWLDRLSGRAGGGLFLGWCDGGLGDRFLFWLRFWLSGCFGCGFVDGAGWVCCGRNVGHSLLRCFFRCFRCLWIKEEEGDASENKSQGEDDETSTYQKEGFVFFRSFGECLGGGGVVNAGGCCC